MATKHYEYDPVSGKQVLVGTTTPTKENGVVTGYTYQPASTGTTSASNNTTNKGGTTVQSGSTSTATGNSQYSGWKPADTSGNNYGQMVGMSDIHQAALKAAGDSWQDAYARGDQKAMDSAHEQAEAIRALYGYSGGEDGSQYLVNIPGGNNEGFSYAPAPTHTDPYSSRIDKMLNEVLNRDAFSYDALSDPLYQQYSQQYQREGERAMQDTLGQVSARTGGLASSYATSAAAQANNYYASQLADKIPELYQLAYSMYLDDIDGKVRDLGLLENASDRQYNRYQDTLDAWRSDRDFAYDRYNDDIDRQLYADEWMYNVGRNNILDAEKKDSTDYERDRNQKTDAYNRAWDLIDSGVMPDDEQLKAAGISTTQAAAIIAAQKAAAAAKGSSGSGGGDPAPKPAELDYEGLFAAALKSQDPESYIYNSFKQYGFTSDKNLYNAYLKWEEANKTPEAEPTQEYAKVPKYDDKVGNGNGESWVSVPGYGRLGWDELEKLVDAGKIKETEKNGKYWYTKVN